MRRILWPLLTGKLASVNQGKCYLDAFNPATRDYMFGQLVDGYVSHGISTFWLDATEPQGANIGEWYYRLDDGKTHRDTEVTRNDSLWHHTKECISRNRGDRSEWPGCSSTTVSCTTASWRRASTRSLSSRALLSPVPNAMV